MSDSHQRRATPIRAFVIPSDGRTIGPQEWASRELHAVWYGLPEEGEYPHPAGGTYRRCKVEVFDGNQESLGYLPLPARYASHWVQLCYSVVYWMTQWKAWGRELGEPARVPRQPAGFVTACMNNTGARFLKYLTARRLIIDELLEHEMSKDGSDELLVFDEFIIRDRFDWLWTEYKDVPDRDLKYLGLSPAHAGNERTFTKRDSGRSQEPEAPRPRRNASSTDAAHEHLDLGQDQPL
ncbi:hypothetical protein JVU11DRAFT_7207 [Chiua virens]|nr:hypothetical protein JVU11DRAFT_7207 [Chiua virens]